MSEEWRPVAGQEGFYEVSSLGRVRSIDRTFVRADGQRQGRRGRILVSQLSGTKRNYPSVTLRFGRRKAVHVLVCEAFHGPRPPGDYEVAHFNGLPADNRATNLRWATPLENSADARRHGTLRTPPGVGSGEQNGNSVLTWDLVEQLRAEAASGVPTRRLAEKYGVGKSQAHNIVSGKQWRQEWAL